MAPASSDAGADADARAPARTARLRAIAVVVHRYVGLAISVFLIVAGLTGSLLAFNEELDAAINPDLFEVTPPRDGAEPLDALALRDALQARLPDGARVSYVPLEREQGHSLSLFVDDSPPGADDEYFVDPYTGETLGSRRWGDIGQGTVNLMPFVYRLHYSLALDDIGVLLFGIVALLWTIDCFVAAYLTFPPRRRRDAPSERPWLSRWKPSWLLRTGKLFSLVFTWHRASGLWVWAMLLVFAWSAVGLNLQEVYQPTMSALFDMKPRGRDTLPRLEHPRHDPELGWREAVSTARDELERVAEERGFEVTGERAIYYDVHSGTYQYRARTTLDVSHRFASTRLWIDGNSGERIAFEAPTGEATGNTITTWIYMLHFGAVGGLGWPYRVFVCLMGLAVAVLSVTGVWVWWRKLQVRRRKKRAPA